MQEHVIRLLFAQKWIYNSKFNKYSTIARFVLHVSMLVF